MADVYQKYILLCPSCDGETLCNWDEVRLKDKVVCAHCDRISQVCNVIAAYRDGKKTKKHFGTRL